MKGTQSYIQSIYECATGVAFLLVYLVGFGLSVYSSFPLLLRSVHSHTVEMHCTTSFCTCSHKAGDCSTCDLKNSDNHTPAYKRCANPISDNYTGSSISAFVVETQATFFQFSTTEYVNTNLVCLSTQFAADPPLHPPQLV